MKLDNFIKRASNSPTLSVERFCQIKSYIKTKDKIEFAKELSERYAQVINETKDSNIMSNYVYFVIFNLLAVKYYTNLELEITIDEFDILQENNLINEILKCVGSDYLLLKSFCIAE